MDANMCGFRSPFVVVSEYTPSHHHQSLADTLSTKLSAETFSSITLKDDSVYA